MNNMPSRVSMQQMSNRMNRNGKTNSGTKSMMQNSEQVDPFMLIIMNMMMQSEQMNISQNNELTANSEGQNALLTVLGNQSGNVIQMDTFVQAVLEQVNNTENGNQRLSSEQSNVLQNAFQGILANTETNVTGEKSTTDDSSMATFSQLLGISTDQVEQETVANTVNKANSSVANTEDPMSILSKFSENVEKVKEILANGNGKNVKTEDKEIDVDALMQQIKSEKTTTPFEMHLKNITPTSETPVFEQMKVGIKQNIDAGNNEFTIKLNPESLGEITVKIVEDAGKTTLSITASNSQTVKLINNDLSALKEAVAPMGVKVEEAIMNIGQSAANTMHQFEMSGRQYEAQQYVPQTYDGNFLDGQQNAQQEFAGGQFAGQQFAGQQFESQQGSSQSYRSGISGSETMSAEADVENLQGIETVSTKLDRLDYYI